MQLYGAVTKPLSDKAVIKTIDTRYLPDRCLGFKDVQL